MTLDWPTSSVVIAGLAALVAALKVSLPYLVGRSSEKARQAALDDVNKRLRDIEAHLASGVRRMPGRLG